MSSFTVHWSAVPNEAAPGIAGPGSRLFALWPAPVDPDACFEQAGFRDFGDNDERWDQEAEALLTRLVAELARFGDPHMASEPYPLGSWWRSLLTGPEPVNIRAQVELPIRNDALCDCTVAFGESGVSLRSGRGHHLFWISLPEREAGAFTAILAGTAARHPVVRTDLDWRLLA